MTTFTTEDRERAFGATINVEPIPFAGWVNTAPPHIVDSGASVMGMSALELADELEEFSGSGAFKYYLEIATMLRQQADRIADLEARLDERADEVMSLENQIGMMTGYGHN